MRRSKQRLKAPLERLYREFDYARRIQHDAIQFPLRYPDPPDREVVALLTACLAYGRVALFSRELEKVLRVMGPHPATFIERFDPKTDAGRFREFRYRFNRPRDIAAFCLAVQRILLAHGSLRLYFLKGYSEADRDVSPALEQFVQGILEQDLTPVFPRGQRSRGFRHLFPKPSAGGPCKRLHLFLRWMARRDHLDFALWPEVSPAKLIIPLDTHIANMSRAIGLTRLRSHTSRMAKQITESLRLLDPDDPVKYDFALCHKRMSGDCPGRRDPVGCRPCGLRSVCRHWRATPRS
jgi:uncharacterized protein (TIGR02757 family)